MKVTKVIPSGFCKGVIRAIQMVKQAVIDYPDQKIYIIGMLVHNRYVVDAFSLANVTTVDDSKLSKREIIESIDEGVVVFTAHGIDPAVKQLAIDKGLTVIDATCSDVIKNATLVKEYLSKDYDVLYVGKKNHPEAISVLALSEKIHLITDVESVENLQIDNDKIFVTNQTTMSIFDIEKQMKAIKEKYPSCQIVEEICNATKSRQLALTKLEDYDLLIVVGDPKSNNTAQLANIGRSQVNEVIKVENANQLLNYSLEGYENVAITSGASTPTYITNQIIEYLKTQDKQYLEVDLNKVLQF